MTSSVIKNARLQADSRLYGRHVGHTSKKVWVVQTVRKVGPEAGNEVPENRKSKAQHKISQRGVLQNVTIFARQDTQP